jgi:hypothetical protein
MKLNLSKIVARHNKTKELISRFQPGAHGRSTIRAKSGALAVALAVVATSLAIMAPTAAYAADINGVEIVNGIDSGSALRVDVMWASTSAMQGAFLWPNNASASQEFDLLDSGNGFFRIRARHSGQCLMLDWRGGSYINGTKIIQHPYCGANYAPAEWTTKWIWKSNGCTGDKCFTNGNWYKLIKNRATGKCLDADNGAGGMPRQQAVLQQWDCISSPDQWNAWNQLWNFGVATSLQGPGPR